MTHTEKVALAMTWYDSGLEDRAAFQTLIESLLAQPEQLMSDRINYGMSVTQGGKRIDPMSIYKEPEQEQAPVAVYGYCPECGAKGVMRERRPNGNDKCANGHTYPSSTSTPPQRTWVGLTEQDLDYLCNLAYTGDEEFALAVQAKLMEKNA